jgi:hypothetical protein
MAIRKNRSRPRSPPLLPLTHFNRLCLRLTVFVYRLIVRARIIASGVKPAGSSAARLFLPVPSTAVLVPLAAGASNA